jgi:hypothetical protein
MTNANQLQNGTTRHPSAPHPVVLLRTTAEEGEANFKSEVLLTNNMVFVSTNLATYGIDVNTHKTVWSYPQVGRLALSKIGILDIQGTNVLLALNLK